MKHYIWMEVKTTNESRLLVKLFKAGINVYGITYGNGVIRFQICAEDRKLLKKIPGYTFHKVRDSGLFALLAYFKKRILVLLGIMLFVLFLFLVSHVMVSVQVIHSNKEIRDLVTKSLEDYGIHRLTWKKNFQEIENIKQQILNDYPNQLEWLEIEVSGMKYIVRIEERIITNPDEKKKQCHLIATKSAIVKKMLFSSGEAKVLVNDFVKDGDILISGELIHNEEVKGFVCATGDVYGEVWYTVKVSLPLIYEETEETGKVRWNFGWSKGDLDHIVFRPRVQSYITEKKPLFTLFGIQFSFLKQKEVTITQKTYTEEEAINKALLLVDEKMKQQIDQNDEITTKKVLKKQLNDSTMDIEVFVSVVEKISRQEEFQEIKEEG